MRRCMAVISWFFSGIVCAEATFTIAWREVAQVHTGAAGEPAIVKPLAAKVPPQVLAMKIERMSIEPAVVRTRVGSLVCLSQFDIVALGKAGERASSVPLELAMQEQQMRKLTFESKPKDLCFRPTQPGELALRLTSKVPASDGTYRGAQAFVRAE